MLVPAAIEIVQFGSADEVTALVNFLGVRHFVIGNFLEPYIMSNSLNSSPFAVLLSRTGRL